MVIISFTFCVSQKSKENKEGTVTKQLKIEKDTITRAKEDIELLKLKMFIGSQKI